MAVSITLNTYQGLVGAFADFLTVAVHGILYERDIYPRTSFLSARKYNFPVRQNRHPKVCKWITDAVSAVEAAMLKGTVARVVVLIYSASSQPLERFIFDVSNFPTVPVGEILTPFENSDLSLADLTEQFRGAMQKLAFCGSSLSPLPPGCSFTVCIELKDQAEAPLETSTTPWIPAQPSIQISTGGIKRSTMLDSQSANTDPNGPGGGNRKGANIGGVKTTPVRTLEAGPFRLEVWVEEGKAKPGTPSVPSQVNRV